MARKTLNQHGFEHITVAMILVVLVAVGGVGYYVASNPKSAKNVQQAAKSTTNSSASTTLKTKSDITSAKNSLNSEAVETDLNPTQLDKDMSDLR